MTTSNPKYVQFLPGLTPTNKKSQKISGIQIQFLNFGNCDPIKNSWILFSEI